MRQKMTRERIRELLRELARSRPVKTPTSIYLVGGGTAVYLGWRSSSVDVDLCADRDDAFRGIQAIKERLNVNIEIARPEDFVPPLKGSSRRHVFIETIGAISFYHYDPCAQLLAKIVRGFERDLEDARHFVRSGMVDRERFRALVAAIPAAIYDKYPNLSRAAVERAVETFISDEEGAPG